MRLSSENMFTTMLIIIFLSTIVSASFASNLTTALTETVVKVEPALIEFGNSAGDPILIPGTQFNVTVKIYNVTNLYGFDLKFRWNTTFLQYVNHSISVPRDTYPDGVLWNPIFGPISDEVNTTAGTYWIAYASRDPAPSFNGTGTVFNMTFRVKYHPVQSTANIALELYSTELPNNAAQPIPHTRQHGTVILYALSPPVPVGGISIPVNKLDLLAPYIGLTLLLAVAAVTVVYVKKRKRNTEINS